MHIPQVLSPEQVRAMRAAIDLEAEKLILYGAEQGLLDEQGRELGLHLIWIPHDLMDPRTVSRRSMRDMVSSYMDTVMHATPVDETLLDFADDVCM